MRLILRFWDAVPIRVIAQFQHLVDFPRLAFGFEVSSSKYSATLIASSRDAVTPARSRCRDG